jgi:hypothetical protein
METTMRVADRSALWQNELRTSRWTARPAQSPGDRAKYFIGGVPVQALPGVPRGGVRNQFQGVLSDGQAFALRRLNTERQGQLIRSVYLSELGREPEGRIENHLAAWAPLFRDLGDDLDEVRSRAVASFRASPEYQSRKMPVSDDTLIESVFASELYRQTSIPEERNFWKQTLNAWRARGGNLSTDDLRGRLVRAMRETPAWDEVQNELVF